MLSLFDKLSTTGKLLVGALFSVFLMGLFADLGMTGLMVASTVAAVVLCFASLFSWIE